MKPLTDLLKEHGNEIKQRLHLGYVHWEDLVNKIEIQERAASGIFSNEQVWTFLAGCGYAISGAEGLAKLANILTGTDLPHPDDAKIWLEVLPLPPRNNEGSTHIDLAIGSIIRRGIFQKRHQPRARPPTLDMLLRDEVGQRHQFERQTRPRPEPTGPSDRKCPLFPKRRQVFR